MGGDFSNKIFPKNSFAMAVLLLMSNLSVIFTKMSRFVLYKANTKREFSVRKEPFSIMGRVFKFCSTSRLQVELYSLGTHLMYKTKFAV